MSGGETKIAEKFSIECKFEFTSYANFDAVLIYTRTHSRAPVFTRLVYGLVVPRRCFFSLSNGSSALQQIIWNSVVGYNPRTQNYRNNPKKT